MQRRHAPPCACLECILSTKSGVWCGRVWCSIKSAPPPHFFAAYTVVCPSPAILAAWPQNAAAYAPWDPPMGASRKQGKHGFAGGGACVFLPVHIGSGGKTQRGWCPPPRGRSPGFDTKRKHGELGLAKHVLFSGIMSCTWGICTRLQ